MYIRTVVEMWYVRHILLSNYIFRPRQNAPHMERMMKLEFSPSVLQHSFALIGYTTVEECKGARWRE
jgi:hypothetical protein